jgi:hypothetical protein
MNSPSFVRYFYADNQKRPDAGGEAVCVCVWGGGGGGGGVILRSTAPTAKYPINRWCHESELG